MNKEQMQLLLRYAESIGIHPHSLCVALHMAQDCVKYQLIIPERYGTIALDDIKSWDWTK